MKLKNVTTRNTNVLAPHSKNGGEIKHISILAGSTIELTKEEMKPVLKPLQDLLDAGILVEVKETKTVQLVEEVKEEVKKTPVKK